MDISTIQRKNRTTKTMETIFVLHFEHKYSFNKFIDMLNQEGFPEVANFACIHWNDDGKYCDTGGTCILHENYMAMVFTFLLGEELNKRK